MNYQQLIANITPEIHTSLKRAIEIGRWPDGRRLSAEQRELCMEAVIAYEAAHVAGNERVGYIDRGKKAEGAVCDDDHDHAAADDEPRPLQWK
jgi:uncharacterized protein YeaC (DUF1315 family)